MPTRPSRTIVQETEKEEPGADQSGDEEKAEESLMIEEPLTTCQIAMSPIRRPFLLGTNIRVRQLFLPDSALIVDDNDMEGALTLSGLPLASLQFVWRLCLTPIHTDCLTGVLALNRCYWETLSLVRLWITMMVTGSDPISKSTLGWKLSFTSHNPKTRDVWLSLDISGLRRIHLGAYVLATRLTKPEGTVTVPRLPTYEEALVRMSQMENTSVMALDSLMSFQDFSHGRCDFTA